MVSSPRVFAIPGIAALIVLVLARPQELFTALQRIPLLYVFAVLAVVGYVVDLRLRRVQPIGATSLPWVIAFMLWAIVCTAVMAPNLLLTRIIEFLILFTLYFTISHGVQTFRAFQAVAGILALTCLFISAICFQQGFSHTECLNVRDDADGIPDGRACDTREECRGADPELGNEYHCDHVGLFGITAVDGRVRYTGELHDPNEVSLTICAGALAVLFGFAIRSRAGPMRIGVAFGVVLVVWTVVMTASRGGLVMMLLVPGVYAVRRWGWRAIIPALLVAVPILMLGGRGGADAELSTDMRYEAWATGLTLFHHNPIFGVAPRQFTEYHFLTAHNSYVLTLAEMGFVGLVLFLALLYLSIKSLVVGLREIRDVPGTAVAQVWGMSLLAAMCGVVFQIGTLSFAYHSVLWIFFGLVGAWCAALRHHRPSFQVRLSLRDIIIIIMAALLYALVVLPLFLHAKGFM